MSIRHALLALVSEGPKYGLQLRHEFEERTGEVWPLNVGQVYQTLQRLERDGLVEGVVESDDDSADGTQKLFRITPAGATELAEWLRTPPDLTSPPRDDLVIKVLIAVRLPGVDVRDVIQTHRRHLVELMQQWTRMKADAGPDDVSLALVVDAELFRLDSVIRWLDAADARLRRAGDVGAASNDDRARSAPRARGAGQPGARQPGAGQPGADETKAPAHRRAGAPR
jgi:DNA-binding PadR family transcriptional regulator